MSVSEYPCLHATGINLYAKGGAGGIVLKIHIRTTGDRQTQLKNAMDITNQFEFGGNRWFNKDIGILVGRCFYQAVRLKLRVINKRHAWCEQQVEVLTVGADSWLQENQLGEFSSSLIHVINPKKGVSGRRGGLSKAVTGDYLIAERTGSVVQSEADFAVAIFSGVGNRC